MQDDNGRKSPLSLLNNNQGRDSKDSDSDEEMELMPMESAALEDKMVPVPCTLASGQQET